MATNGKRPMCLSDLERASGIPRQEIATLLRYEDVPVETVGKQRIVMPQHLARVAEILSRLPGVNAAFIGEYCATAGA